MDLPQEFEIFRTEDGSPTLSFRHRNVVEKMHHSKGALNESLYIYGEALKICLNEGWPVRVLSVGLGLGYNELIAAAVCLERGLSRSDAHIWSFENLPFLRESFQAWLQEQPSALAEIYKEIGESISQQFAVSEHSLKQFLRDSLELRTSYPEDTSQIENVSCVFFDAYSSKMSPELWGEETLHSNLLRFIAPQCVLTTYAATGNLKRALRALDFQLIPKLGFSGKRDCTLAIRGKI